MVGWSMARSTRSGTLVGPGICRKWRPVWTDMTATSSGDEALHGVRHRRKHGGWKFIGRSPLIAPNREGGMAQPTIETGDPALAARLAKTLRGEVLFDAASRGRY